MNEPDPAAEALVAYYLEALRRTDSEDALHSLTEIGPEAFPHLAQAYAREGDVRTRARLVEAIRQYRLPEVVPFLAEALRDPEPAVWREALNGLVALRCPEAVTALRQALSEAPTADPQACGYREWVQEALEQALDTSSQ